jgi:Protein of unknown function (DUF1566)
MRTLTFPSLLTLLRGAAFAASLFGAYSVHAAGPTGFLNDTGQTQCGNDTMMVACTAAVTGDAGTHKRQDGRFGRDPAAPAKVGGGSAGFDFTKVCMDGTLNCGTMADAGATPASTAWACTKDNITNLIWSLHSGSGNWTTYARTTLPAARNMGAGRCGGTGWRLPTRRELLSIVDFSGVSPSIDSANFPMTQVNLYWATDPYQPDPAFAWVVYFYDGYSYPYGTSNTNFVRLVRSGQ